jgi:hypothetical protein
MPPPNDRTGPWRGPAHQKTTRLQALDSAPSLIPTDSLDDIAAHVDGTFVVLVRVTGGKYRRRCFLTVASAERAARRAQAAGHNATIYLAELKPLWKLAGGTVGS